MKFDFETECTGVDEILETLTIYDKGTVSFKDDSVLLMFKDPELKIKIEDIEENNAAIIVTQTFTKTVIKLYTDTDKILPNYKLEVLPIHLTGFFKREITVWNLQDIKELIEREEKENE